MNNLKSAKENQNSTYKSRIYTRSELDAMTNEELAEVYKNIDRSKKIQLPPLPPAGDEPSLDRNMAIDMTIVLLQIQNELIDALSKGQSDKKTENTLHELQNSIDKLVIELNTALDILDRMDYEGRDSGLVVLELPNAEQLLDIIKPIEEGQHDLKPIIDALPPIGTDPPATKSIDLSVATSTINKNTKSAEGLEERKKYPPSLPIPTPEPSEEPEDGDEDDDGGGGGDKEDMDQDTDNENKDSGDQEDQEKDTEDDANSKWINTEQVDLEEASGDRGDTSQSTVNIIKQAQAELLAGNQDLVKQVRNVTVSTSLGMPSKLDPGDYIQQLFEIAGSYLTRGGRSGSYFIADRMSNDTPDESGIIQISKGTQRKSRHAKLTIYLDVSGSMGREPIKILHRLVADAAKLERTKSIVVPFGTDLHSPLDLSLGVPNRLPSDPSTDINRVLDAIAGKVELRANIKDPFGGISSQMIPLKADLSVIITDMDNNVDGKLDFNRIPYEEQVIFITNKEGNAEEARKAAGSNIDVIYTKEW